MGTYTFKLKDDHTFFQWLDSEVSGCSMVGCAVQAVRSSDPWLGKVSSGFQLCLVKKGLN